jgi:hypothetical protein
VAVCELPVVISRFDKATGAWTPDTAGFISYPAGEFTRANADGVRYDARRKRWLPAGLPTPDGAAYLYADATSNIHRVTVDSGVDDVILRGSWVPIGFENGELYLAEVRLIPEGAFGAGGYIQGGLAKVAASGGTPVFITNHPGPWWISSRGAWSFDRADGLMQAPDRVLHLDLNTGAVEPWLSGVPGVMLSGFDSQGHPFVFNHGDTLRVVRLIGKDDAREVFLGAYAAPWPEPPFFVDGERVWFSGFSITDPTFEAPALLYQPGVGLRPSIGVPGSQVRVAGPCTNR